MFLELMLGFIVCCSGMVVFAFAFQGVFPKLVDRLMSPVFKQSPPAIPARSDREPPSLPAGLESFTALAERLHLGGPNQRIASGTVDGLAVELRPLSDQELRGDQFDTRLDVMLAGASRWLRLAARDARGPPQTSPIGTGDPALDELVYCFGPADVVRATMGATTRQALIELGGHVRLINTRFTFLFSRTDGDALVRIREAIEAARTLELVSHVPELIAEIITNDPVPSVRCKALATLAELHSTSTQLESAIKLASDDADPNVRLEAAHHVSDPERARAIGLGVFQSSDEVRTRQAALLLVASHRHRGDATFLLQALAQSDGELLLAALEAIAIHGDAQNALGVRERIRGSSAAILARGARTLTALGGTTAEDGLIELLPAHPGVALVAIQGLTEIGTQRCLLPLNQCKERHAKLEFQIRRAREVVIARGAASGGELAVVTGDSLGALSLRNPEAGALAEISGDAVTPDDG